MAEGNGSIELVHEWLRRFAAAVRSRDYTRARTLFDRKVIAFGTVTEHVACLDDLVRAQWRVIWPITRGFDFEYATLRVGTTGDLAWVAVRWSSTEVERARPRPRRGRATFVLRHGRGGWRATHSHFSLVPRSAARRP